MQRRRFHSAANHLCSGQTRNAGSFVWTSNVGFSDMAHTRARVLTHTHTSVVFPKGGRHWWIVSLYEHDKPGYCYPVFLCPPPTFPHTQSLSLHIYISIILSIFHFLCGATFSGHVKLNSPTFPTQRSATDLRSDVDRNITWKGPFYVLGHLV